MFFCACQNPAPSYPAHQDAEPWCCQAPFQLPKEKELIKRVEEPRCQAPFPAQSCGYNTRWPDPWALSSSCSAHPRARAVGSAVPGPHYCCLSYPTSESCRIDPSQGTPRPVLFRPLYFKKILSKMPASYLSPPFFPQGGEKAHAVPFISPGPLSGQHTSSHLFCLRFKLCLLGQK